MPINIGGAGGGQSSPEQIVTGTGTYVIPAGKYGLLTMNTSVAASARAASQNAASNSNGSGSSNSVQQWVVAGDTITTQTSFPSISISTANSGNNVIAYTKVLINGTVVCSSHAGMAAQTTSSGSPTTGNGASTGDASWSFAMYSI